MKYPIGFLSLALCLVGCSIKDSSTDGTVEEQPRVAVTLTHGVYGHIEQMMTFSATTVYQNKSVIATPISAFIMQQFVSAGTRVKAGQVLCNLESKERHAVGRSDNSGIIPIKAMRSGIVLNVQQLTGDYVTEGTILCTIAESGSLIFEINVPYEQRGQIQSGDKCTLELPDGTRLPATVRLPLATMNTVSQSERILASARAPFLPEGLHVKALFPVSKQTDKSMLLPESAVQSDETLTEHWVMKLTGNSTAVKIPVKVVGRNSSEVEILSDSLSPQDNIILTGGYGLENGRKVVIAQKEGTL